METAISTTRLHSLSGSLRSLAGIPIHHSPVVHSFIMLCHAPLILLPRMPFLSQETDRQAHESIPRPGYLLQPCVTFSTVPSSEVCTFNLRKTQNKQQPGQLFFFFFLFLPGKVSYLLFFFALSDVPVGVVVHSRHISWLDYAVLFWEIGFGKGLV